MQSRRTLACRFCLGGLLAGALLWAGCDSGPDQAGGIQVGAAPTLPVPTDAPCVDTFPADEPEEFKPDFGVDRPAKEKALPRLLSKTGLYIDIRTKETQKVAAIPQQCTATADERAAHDVRWMMGVVVDARCGNPGGEACGREAKGGEHAVELELEPRASEGEFPWNVAKPRSTHEP